MVIRQLKDGRWIVYYRDLDGSGKTVEECVHRRNFAWLVIAFLFAQVLALPIHFTTDPIDKDVTGDSQVDARDGVFIIHGVKELK